MNYGLLAAGIVLVIGIILLIKNELVYKASIKANKIIFSKVNWEELLDEHKPDGSYNQRFFHPFKWTFKQMFPGLEDDELS